MLVFLDLLFGLYMYPVQELYMTRFLLLGGGLLEAEVQVPYFVDPLKLVVGAGLLSSLGQTPPR